MKPKTIFLSTLATLVFLASPSAFAQKVEITPHVGGQINGGVDLSTTLFHRLEVQNGLSYGVTGGYLFGEHFGIEFQWNHNNAGTTAQPIGGGPSIKVFNLNQNQYMGNFLIHFTPEDAKTRPFFLVGLGATALSPDRSRVSGSTRFAFAVGAGLKHNLSKHFGLRGQIKYTPTYLTSTSSGYWCDPIWGGCWVSGNSHYLNAFDASGGITLRF